MRSLLTILFSLVALVVSAGTIEVGKDKITKYLKAGVSLAKSGDTILLYPGLYKEGNIVISKQIHLLGVGNPVLDGELKHEMLTITGHNIVVKGITFRNAGYSSFNDYAAIKIIDAGNVRVEDNNIA